MLAAVYYTGASGEEWHFIPFSKDYTGWQFASGIVVLFSRHYEKTAQPKLYRFVRSY